MLKEDDQSCKFRKLLHFAVMKPLKSGRNTTFTPFYNIMKSKTEDDIDSKITINIILIFFPTLSETTNFRYEINWFFLSIYPP